LQPTKPSNTCLVFASCAPSPYCQPQGTSPNSTTTPLPCQIRQALFFFVFYSASASLPPNPLPPTPKHHPTSLTGYQGTITYFITLRPTKSNPQPYPKILSPPTPYSVNKQMIAYIANVLPLKMSTIFKRIAIISPFSWPVKFKIGQNETSRDEQRIDNTQLCVIGGLGV